MTAHVADLALAHAGGYDEITYAVSVLMFAFAIWLAIAAIRRRRAERRSGAQPEPPADDSA